MARKPNFKFERLERERKKAEKKAERAKMKEERKLAAQMPDGNTAADTGTEQAPAEE